jgi:hypothetical protein
MDGKQDSEEKVRCAKGRLAPRNLPFTDDEDVGCAFG